MSADPLRHPGKPTNHRRADRGPVPAAPAKPARSCRGACRSGQPSAIPAPPRGPGSSPLQDLQHQPQRRGLDTLADANTIPPGQPDLDPLAGAGWCHPLRPIRLTLTGSKRSSAGSAAPIAPPPGENLVGVHVAAPRHPRHRRARHQACRHNPPLQRPRPRSMPPSLVCAHNRVRGHFLSPRRFR
jgi:hypothetical protein